SGGSNPANIGDVITITLDATETLVQSGAPTLSLDVGGVARAAAFSAINAGNAQFTYSCDALAGNWYLPALAELDVIYSNLAEGEHLANDDTDNPRLTTGGGNGDAGNLNGPLVASFNISGSTYWSSSETGATSAWYQRFSDGNQFNNGKSNGLFARCTRR
ncbi:MAG TPA: hypothetical protein VIF12_06850, partial [Micavibrio sp.]